MAYCLGVIVTLTSENLFRSISALLIEVGIPNFVGNDFITAGPFWLLKYMALTFDLLIELQN